jgi:hypothetical protein
MTNDDDQETEILADLDDLDKSVGVTPSVYDVPQDFKDSASEILRQCAGPDAEKKLGPFIWIAVATLLFEIFKWFMNRKKAQWMLHRAYNHPQGVIAAMMAEKFRGWLPEEARDTQIPEKMIAELRKKVVASVSGDRK